MSARWLQRSVIVTVGTGGVGKTTMAAAIALEAAARGRRALVLTIDPAHRLANALGVEGLGHEPQRVPADRFAAGAPGGSLFAMMLDTQRTFDEILERVAPDPELRRRIASNKIYRSLTDALSGSREFSALEKLHEIHASGEYDCIVLDTPPATHALDFLDAPRRLLGFLDGSFLELLLRPAAALGRTGLRMFRLGSDAALRALESLTGFTLLRDLSEFFRAFEGMLGGFRERAERVGRLLRDPSCGFVLVAGPDAEQVRHAVSFWSRLQRERVQLVGLIVNRMQIWPGESVPEVGPGGRAEDDAWAWLEPQLGAELGARLVQLARDHAALARRDAEGAERLEKAIPLERSEMRRIPMQAEDIHAVRGLAELRAQLFGAS